MGNIYADEALWRAQIHPLRPAGDLDATELKRLHKAVREALKAGIAARGYPARLPYSGRRGGADAVRAPRVRPGGRPCYRCGDQIGKTRAAGRRPGTAELPTARTSGNRR